MSSNAWINSGLPKIACAANAREIISELAEYVGGVDADLARVYVVPFDAITASPATPGIVSDLTDYAAAVWLFRVGGAPNSDDAAAFERLYNALLEDIRAGRRAVPGATPVAADSGITGAVFSYADAQFAGVDSSGTRRSGGLF